MEIPAKNWKTAVFFICRFPGTFSHHIANLLIAKQMPVRYDCCIWYTWIYLTYCHRFHRGTLWGNMMAWGHSKTARCDPEACAKFLGSSFPRKETQSEYKSEWVMMYHNHMDPVRDRKRLCSFHSVQANRALPFAFICQGKRVAKAKAFDVVPYFVSHFFCRECVLYFSEPFNQYLPNHSQFSAKSLRIPCAPTVSRCAATCPNLLWYQRFPNMPARHCMSPSRAPINGLPWNILEATRDLASCVKYVLLHDVSCTLWFQCLCLPLPLELTIQPRQERLPPEMPRSKSKQL